MRLRNKLLITFLIILLLFLLPKNISYASTDFAVGEYTYKFNETTSSGFDTSTYNYLIYSNYYEEGKVQFKILYWYKEDNLILSYYGDNNKYVKFNVECSTSRSKDLFMDYTVGTTSIGTTKELSFTKVPSSYNTSSEVYCDYIDIFLDDIVTSTQDIYLDETLLFQSPLVQQVTFQELVEEINLEPIKMTLIKVLGKVAMIVVGLIALYLGWQSLSKILRTG